MSSVQPFTPTGQLRLQLIQRFLIPALDWLADCFDDSSTTLLPVKTGNVWGTANVLILLFQAKPILQETGGFSGDYTKTINPSIDFLLAKVKEDKETASWDAGLYDTSVVLRSFLYYLEYDPDPARVPRLLDLLQKGMCWISRSVERWEAERYSFGIADLAQSLRTCILLKAMRDKNPSLLTRVLSPSLQERIVADLLNLGTSGDVQLDPSLYGQSGNRRPFEQDSVRPELLFRSSRYEFRGWSDVWNASESLIALTNYYLCNQSTEIERLGKIAGEIQRQVRFLELEHIDGKWGLPDVTSLALIAYLRAHTIWQDNPGHVEPQHHLVFKTIRWLCDDKQHFRDGSILHQVGHTLFFALAIREACSRWLKPDTPLDGQVIDLYDYILWQMPARTGPERGKTLQMQGLLEKAGLTEKDLRTDLRIARGQALRWKLVSLMALWLALGLAFSMLFDFITVRIERIEVGRWQELLALVAIWLGLTPFVFRSTFGSFSKLIKESSNE